MTTPTEDHAPALSVVFPTHARPAAVARLLEGLRAQTLPPERFEVLVVDDGSPEPVALAPEDYPYTLTVLRQEHAGPAAARNLGIEKARAPLTLLLADDVLPAESLLAGHLSAHAEAPPRCAVLGSFQFTEGARRSPFVELLATTNLWFDFPGLRDRELNAWTFFRACNLSLCTEVLRLEGFDESFNQPVVEDVELGYRLEKEGWRVLHRAELVAEHDHEYTPSEFFDRAVQLGTQLARMSAKHDDPRLLWYPREMGRAEYDAMQFRVQENHESGKRLHAILEDVEARFRGRELSDELRSMLYDAVLEIELVHLYRGILLETFGYDPGPALDSPPESAPLTSVVVLATGTDPLRRCLRELRDHAEPGFPIELLVVTNGTEDGLPELLAEQEDVSWCEHPAGGPLHHRNLALQRAQGEWVVFLDEDVVVTPHWLSRLLRHAAVDGAASCLCPVTDAGTEGAPRDLVMFAEEWHAAGPLAYEPRTSFHSPCFLARRSVLDQLGSFDESFSTCRVGEDDLTLRARLAGLRGRIARDVFVLWNGGPDTTEETLADWERFAVKWKVDPGLGFSDLDTLQGHLDEIAARTRSEPSKPTTDRGAAA